MKPFLIKALGPRRHIFLRCLLVFLGLVALCPLDSVQGREIAILKSKNITLYNEAIAGFKNSGDLNDVTFTEYDLRGSFERGKKIAEKLRGTPPDLVLAVGLKAALAAKLEILDTPVVFGMVLNPAKYDLKGPNMTGITLEVPLESQFTTIKSVLPGVTKVGVLFDEGKSGDLVAEGRSVAKRLGIELVEAKVGSQKEVPKILRELVGKIDALWLIPDRTVITRNSMKFILATALDHQIPVIGFASEFVRSGGALVGLSVSSQGVGQQAARLASRIMAGQVTIAKAAHPPEKVQMSLSLKTARLLGITIPAQVVNSADELYGKKEDSPQ